MPTLTAVYLSDPHLNGQVRKKDGGFFKRANQQEMLTMLAYGAIEPCRLENGRIQYWKLNCSATRMKLALNAQRGRIDAEANHTVMRGLGGFSHRMRICASYGHP